MLYPDTVEAEALVHRPRFVAAVFAVVFVIFFAIWWILWGVLMYKTYHGQPYRVPVFSNLAEKCLATLDAKR